MSYNQLKWLILLIPTITVGVWEYVRHEYLLPYISMDLGNWLTPVIVLFVTFTLLTRLFRKIELMQEQLQRERTAKAALEERERIARELHDGLAQSLFLLSVKMKQLKNIKVAEEDLKTFEEIQQRLFDIHHYVRTGIENLRQPVVDELHFKEVVYDELNRFERETDIQVIIDIQIDEAKMTTQEKRELTFCLKEALMNVHKHAKASHVSIYIRIDEEQKMMVVKDDGIGFQIDKPLVGHYGLRMMEERCAKIGWHFAIKRENGYTALYFIKEEEGSQNDGANSHLDRR
ncbi:MAG: sensor histidine kinase [Bacilli bacterium]|nr:sensor histidine kinase [Bacilli bacterium]